MPSPPRKGEGRKAFISRCHREIAGEFKDPAQRHAVCMNYWRKHLSKVTSEKLAALKKGILKFEGKK
jgi:hypothetical protein